MPSANKTSNYNLNQWQGNEYLKREDLNTDNAIIDAEIKNVNDKADGKISKSLATAASQFLVSSGIGQWAAKTIAETKTLLGLGSAAYTDSSAYATAAQGIKADNAATQADFNTHVVDTVAHGINTKVNVSEFNAHLSDTTVHVKKDGTLQTNLNADKLDGNDSTAFATAAQGTKADNAMPKAGGVFMGAVAVPASTNYVNSQLRNTVLATTDPTGGANGDIWFKYTP